MADKHIIKKILLVSTVVILSIFIVEIFAGYLLWIKKSNVPCSMNYILHKIYLRLCGLDKNKVSFFPNSMYIPDKYLGYSCMPGSYTVTVTDKTTGKYHNFKITINENGHRITTMAPSLFEGKREIWICGDSFAFGWGNNDETSFPFFLQQYLPNYRIVNYADNGYGNVHAYLQIKRQFKNKSVSPAVIVIVYADFFNIRNVAAPSRLKEFRYDDVIWKDKDTSRFLHPRAVLDTKGCKIEYVPLFWKFNDLSKDTDPIIEYQYQVTKRILGEIYKMGKENNAKIILAYVHGKDSDEVISYATELGYVIADIRPRSDESELDRFMLSDGHPSPLAQDKYAVKLYATISRLLAIDNKLDKYNNTKSYIQSNNKLSK